LFKFGQIYSHNEHYLSRGFHDDGCYPKILPLISYWGKIFVLKKYLSELQPGFIAAYII